MSSQVIDEIDLKDEIVKIARISIAKKKLKKSTANLEKLKEKKKENDDKRRRQMWGTYISLCETCKKKIEGFKSEIESTQKELDEYLKQEKATRPIFERLKAETQTIELKIEKENENMKKLNEFLDLQKDDNEDES